jgi:hypothetical protein
MAKNRSTKWKSRLVKGSLCSYCCCYCCRWKGNVDACSRILGVTGRGWNLALSLAVVKLMVQGQLWDCFWIMESLNTSKRHPSTCLCTIMVCDQFNSTETKQSMSPNNRCCVVHNTFNNPKIMLLFVIGKKVIHNHKGVFWNTFKSEW